MAKSRYQVSYVFRGQKRFGILSSAKPKVKGNLVIEDAVLPWAAEVPDDANVKDIPLAKDFPTYDRHTGKITRGGSPYDHFVNAAFVAATARSEAAGTGVKVGKMFTISVADGRAYYVVTKVTKTKAVIEWRGFSGDRYMDHAFGYGKTVSIKEAATYISRVDAWEGYQKRTTDENGAFLAAQPVGTIVHYNNSFNDYTRYEVVDMGGGEKAYKPVGLVGDWKHDLPRRYCTGTVHVPYNAQAVLDRKIAKVLPTTSIFEHPKFSRTQGSHKKLDPTGLPCHNLTVPPMTADQAEAARLWNLITAIKEGMGEREDGADLYNPATPRQVLADAYKALLGEVKEWTVADYKKAGLKA